MGFPDGAREPHQIAVFVDDAPSRERAAAILAKRRPDDVQHYDGIVEGWAAEPELIALERAGLRVEPLVLPLQPNAAARADPGSGRSFSRNKRTDPALQAQFQSFAAKAEKIALASSTPTHDAGRPEAPPRDTAGSEDAYRVWFKGPMRKDWRDQLAALRVESCSYRSSSYQVFLTAAQYEAVRALPFVQAIRPYDLLDTVTARFLVALEQRSKDETSHERRTFDIVLHRAADRDEVKKRVVLAADVELIESSTATLRIAADSAAPVLAALADLTEVATMIPFEPPRLVSDRVRKLIGVVAINDARENGADRWTGKGELVGILDSGIDSTHEDFEGRVKKQIAFRDCPAEDTYGHGTHVAGIIAGSGKAWGAAKEPLVRGVAPEAELVIVGMTDDDGRLVLPVDVGELLGQATAQGARVLNVSWTSETAGAYDTISASVDRFVYDNPDVLVVVAAGNTGRAPDGVHLFGTIGSPASAKNVLTVGSCATDRAEFTDRWGDRFQAAFPKPEAAEERVAGNPALASAISGRGPTDYESVKPDLVAPGTYVLAPRAAKAKPSLFDFWSGSPHPKYGYLSGTSMAAPAVAGAALVLRQYLREKLRIARPSAALLKALLLAATRRLPSRPEDTDIGYPDFHQGFGRLDLSQLLPDVDHPQRTFSFVDVGNDEPEALESRMPLDAPRKSLRRYRLTLAEGARGPLALTLVWTDMPGSSLQNSLQLQARPADGPAVVGNPELAFRRDRFGDTGYGNPMPYDRRNNVQKIEIGDPKPGEYVVSVLAWNTVGKAQGYALCACGELDSELVALETS